MQQGLAFYQHRKLLRFLILFNSSEVPELLVRYAPHITYKHTMETNRSGPWIKDLAATVSRRRPAAGKRPAAG
jgi:hypothetical protein